MKGAVELFITTAAASRHNTHTLSSSWARSQPHRHQRPTHTHTKTHKHTYTQAQTHSNTNTHTHTHTHAYTHRHRHTQTRTNTHTHSIYAHQKIKCSIHNWLWRGQSISGPCIQPSLCGEDSMMGGLSACDWTMHAFVLQRSSSRGPPCQPFSLPTGSR